MLISLSAFLLSSMPPALSEAIAPPKTSPAVASYQFEMADGDVNWLGTISPNNPEGQRISVSRPAKEDWPKGAEKELKAYEAEIDDDVWCDDMGDFVGRDFQTIAETSLTATYSFRPLINEDDDKSDRKFAEVAQGEIDIFRTSEADPWKVKAMRLKIQKPFKPVFIAKINSFEMDVRCEAHASGRMYQAQARSYVTGSAMGQSFDEREDMRVSNIVLAGE